MGDAFVYYIIKWHQTIVRSKPAPKKEKAFTPSSPSKRAKQCTSAKSKNTMSPMAPTPAKWT